MDVNLGAMLAQRAYLSPRKEGFIGKDYRYTFREANDRVDRFAAFLKANGIVAGDRLALCCKNNEHLATGIFAAAKIGAIAAIVNWRLQVPELEYILNDCSAKALLYDEAFAEAVNKIRPSIPARLYIRKGGKSADISYDEVMQQDHGKISETIGGGDDPAVIMYTSGTTGKPKGAVLSHNNMFWSTLAISMTIEWNYDHRFLLMAPMFHIGGLAPLITNVHKGCTTFFMPDFDPVAVWQTIAKERITTMMSVPLMLQAMMMVAQKTEVDTSSLVSITCGASAVPKSIIDAYLKAGVKVQQVYGITEFSGAVTFWTHGMGIEKSHSQGKPVFHGALKIMSPASLQELPLNEVGEIWCHGPMVFREYWNNPQATKEAKMDDWYRSGDLGYRDEEGYFYVVDRLKDMIISGGENIYPAELESVINKLDAVSEVAVVGEPDLKWGEIPVAYIVCKPNTSLTEEQVISFCKEKLASFKCVRKVHLVEALPKNSVGKILKRRLKEGAQG